MSTLPLAIPSGELRGTAERCRVVNWMLAQVETGTGKGGIKAYSKQCPGLRTKVTLGGPVRGLFAAQDRLFAVAGEQLYEIGTDLVATRLGVVGPGGLEAAENQTQLCIVNGSVGYVIDLQASPTTVTVVGEITGRRIDVLDGFGVFADSGTENFFVTTNQDFTQVDPLQFASVESVPGKIIGHVRRQQQVVFFKATGGEVWYDAGTQDFPLARDQSASIAVGLAAVGTLRAAGNDQVIWLGRDKQGAGIVFTLNGYAPQRISKEPLEQKLAPLTDLSEARAWTYHLEGQNYYVLQVPGLDTSWVYDIAAGEWHERGDWTNEGTWEQWRATCHAYAFGIHFVGGSDGVLYELTPDVNRNGNSPLVRDFITPHTAATDNSVQVFRSIEVLCDVGQGVTQVVPEGIVERLTFDDRGNFYNGRGQQTILTGWNNYHNFSILNQADLEQDVAAATGDRVVRFGIKYGGADYPAGVDCRMVGQPGNIDPAKLAIIDNYMAWADAARIWVDFAFDSNAGQGNPGSTYYGIPDSNYLNNPTFRAEMTNVVLPFLVNRYKHYRRIAFWEPWPEPHIPGATDKQTKGIYAEFIDAIQAVDPTTPILIGGRGSYKCTRVAGVYDPSFKNIVYTGDLLDAAVSHPLSLPSKVQALVDLRTRYGVPIFLQQVGVTTANDPDYSKLKGVLDLLNANRIGWTYWEKRGGNTDPSQYSAYYMDGHGGWLIKQDTYDAVVGKFQTQGGFASSLTSDAHLMLRYSNDGGKTWGSWRQLSLGEIGEYKTRVRSTLLGKARDRVWNFRVTDDVNVNLLSALVNEK